MCDLKKITEKSEQILYNADRALSVSGATLISVSEHTKYLEEKSRENDKILFSLL
jgi:hypothetical protein